MLHNFDRVRLSGGEYGVILELLSSEKQTYLIELLEEGDTSGIPLDELPVHVSEIKAKIIKENVEIPLETYGKTIPPFSYVDFMVTCQKKYG